MYAGRDYNIGLIGITRDKLIRLTLITFFDSGYKHKLIEVSQKMMGVASVFKFNYQAISRVPQPKTKPNTFFLKKLPCFNRTAQTQRLICKKHKR